MSKDVGLGFQVPRVVLGHMGGSRMDALGVPSQRPLQNGAVWLIPGHNCKSLGFRMTIV